MLPHSQILIQRDEATAEAVFYYAKLPPAIENLNVILCDPMLATGGSALAAIKCLKEAGVKEEDIVFLNVVSCPEGLRNLEKNAPKASRISTPHRVARTPGPHLLYALTSARKRRAACAASPNFQINESSRRAVVVALSSPAPPRRDAMPRVAACRCE